MLEMADTILFEQNSDGRTALMWTASGGNYECLEAIIYPLSALDPKLTDHIFQQDNFGMTALMLAALGGYVECVKILLRHDRYSDYKTRVDRNGKTALTHAVDAGHGECANAIKKNSFR